MYKIQTDISFAAMFFCYTILLSLSLFLHVDRSFAMDEVKNIDFINQYYQDEGVLYFSDKKTYKYTFEEAAQRKVIIKNHSKNYYLIAANKKIDPGDSYEYIKVNPKDSDFYIEFKPSGCKADEICKIPYSISILTFPKSTMTKNEIINQDVPIEINFKNNVFYDSNSVSYSDNDIYKYTFISDVQRKVIIRNHSKKHYLIAANKKIEPGNSYEYIKSNYKDDKIEISFYSGSLNNENDICVIPYEVIILKVVDGELPDLSRYSSYNNNAKQCFEDSEYPYRPYSVNDKEVSVERAVEFEQVLEEEPFSNDVEEKRELKDVEGVEEFKDENANKILAANNKQNESTSSKTRVYLSKSFDQFWKGNYSDEVTVLGTAAQIGASFTGLDMAMDIRDLTHDIQNWEWSVSHVSKTALDAVGLVPVLGAVKNVDEVAVLAKQGWRAINSGEAKRLFNAFFSEKKVLSGVSNFALKKGIKNVDERSILHSAKQTKKLIPNDAYEVLEYVIKHNGSPPPSIKGGKKYLNDTTKFPGSQKLPESDNYKVYDVYSKTDKGRGDIRIVINTVTGEAYYTANHYKSFIKMN